MSMGSIESAEALRRRALPQLKLAHDLNVIVLSHSLCLFFLLQFYSSKTCRHGVGSGRERRWERREERGVEMRGERRQQERAEEGRERAGEMRGVLHLSLLVTAIVSLFPCQHTCLPSTPSACSLQPLMVRSMSSSHGSYEIYI